jgi:hypothetical protein
MANCFDEEPFVITYACPLCGHFVTLFEKTNKWICENPDCSFEKEDKSESIRNGTI